MAKKIVVAVGVIVVIAVGVSFYLNNIGKERGGSQLETVKVAQFNEFFLYMPLYLANAKGFFAEERLNIEIINTGGDDKTFAAVIGGSATFGIADPTFCSSC
jgi:NitT/TauT family transport system substrate-binding protein